MGSECKGEKSDKIHLGIAEELLYGPREYLENWPKRPNDIAVKTKAQSFILAIVTAISASLVLSDIFRWAQVSEIVVAAVAIVSAGMLPSAWPLQQLLNACSEVAPLGR